MLGLQEGIAFVDLPEFLDGVGIDAAQGPDLLFQFVRLSVQVADIHGSLHAQSGGSRHCQLVGLPHIGRHGSQPLLQAFDPGGKTQAFLFQIRDPAREFFPDPVQIPDLLSQAFLLAGQLF